MVSRGLVGAGTHVRTHARTRRCGAREEAEALFGPCLKRVDEKALTVEFDVAGPLPCEKGACN